VVGDRGGGSELRVAVVHNLLRGGAQRRLISQLDSLEAQTREFTLSSATPMSGEATVVPLVQKAPTSHRLLRPVPRHVDVERVARAWRRLFDEVDRWQPDVVWLNPCHLLQAPALPTGFDAPTFYYCDEPRRADYDDGARASMNPATRPLYAVKRRRERHLDRATVAKVTALATNSAWTARQIERAYGRAAEVIGCGVPDGFSPDASARPSHVLSVGTLIPSKGHDLAIQAAAAAGTTLPSVVVAPRPNAPESERLQRIADELNVDLTIKVGISDDELRDLYRSAYATVYLSRAEPLGLVSLEAQACGSPVIVAAEGGLPETIRDGLTGWAVPRDPAAAAQRLVELAAPARRDSMVLAAAAHAADMTWGASAAAIHKALQRVARKQPAEVAA
jgi:glycosyltransferase involved in cell wall biosynthesis